MKPRKEITHFPLIRFLTSVVFAIGLAASVRVHISRADDEPAPVETMTAPDPAAPDSSNGSPNTATNSGATGPSTDDVSFLALPSFDLEVIGGAAAAGSATASGSTSATGSNAAMVGDLIAVHVLGLGPTNVPGIAHPSTDLHAGNPHAVSAGASTAAAPPPVTAAPGAGSASNAAPAPGGKESNSSETEWSVLPFQAVPLVPAGASPRPAEVDAGAGELRFRIVPLKSGRLTLPSVPLLDGRGKAVARTNPLTFEVKTAIAKDDPKPKDPVTSRPPVSLVFPWAVLVVIGILIVLLAIGIVYLIVKLSRRKRKPIPVVIPAAPPRPEDEVALEALIELEKKALHRRGGYKPHYFGVSDILKTYIGARYRFDAPESTSREIIRTLETEKHPPDEALRLLERAFAKLDFVKFTDHVPDPDEGSELLELARQLVNLTRLPKTPAAGVSNGSANHPPGASPNAV